MKRFIYTNLLWFTIILLKYFGSNKRFSKFVKKLRKKYIINNLIWRN
jgi:hypothetical protein